MWCHSCFESPHNPRCPRVEEPLIAYHCEMCGKPVYEGHESGGYAMPESGYICVVCVFTMSVGDALAYFGCIRQG